MTDEEYINLARIEYHDDGEVEIDSDAEVSNAADGAWVQAWVWVHNPEEGEE